MEWRYVFVLILFLQYFISSSISEDLDNCEGSETCAACIKNPTCAWCSQTDFHGGNKKQLPRCKSVEAHEQLGSFKCQSQHLFNHSNYLKILRDDGLTSGNDESRAVPIRPQRVSIKIRMRDPITFSMNYKEVEDYPLDLYYLMDGTYTMKDDKEVLVSLGDSIGERLRSVTSKFRQGFGTFVDKAASPYIYTIPALFENPCAPIKDTCVQPYGFKNHMKLSNDTRKFRNAVRDFLLSTSSDAPEGGFDALMQVMVCEKEIGWADQARKLILFATDAPFHYAGDGRLGGIFLPNDGNCHLDANGEYYTHSLMNDYPSMSQINSKAKKHSINIIFAVTSEEIEDYNHLTKVVEGSKSTELAKNSSNIVELVEQEYKRMQSKVEMKDSFPTEFFKVSYYSKCNDGTLQERSMCEGLKTGTEVQFQVEIELIKCSQNNSEWKQQHRIYAVGVPDSVEIDVETLCNCPCEKPENWIPNSGLCNRKGSEVCGLCQCHENYDGKNCECNAIGPLETETDGKACVQENSTEICSGRGNCICRQCECINKDRYGGPYCECDNFNCLMTNGKLCADHGVCNCGKCECFPDWGGAGCDCYQKTDSCIEPGSEEECSGMGSCVCGKCKCRERYSGDYCDKCLHPTCPTECEKLNNCVLCKIHNAGALNPSDCELNCFEHSITPVEVITVASSGLSDEVMCKQKDPSDDCTFVFSYKLSRGKKFIIKAQREKECPPKAPIFWIIAGVASIVVIIGLIILCVYRAYQLVQIKKEFAAYELERKNVVWRQETNPIYNNPVGKFQNPMYAGKE